jgi:hypothetical protein
MKINKEDKSISFDEAMATPDLAHLRDILQYVENAPDGTLFPKKYEKGIEYIASNKIYTLYKIKPLTPLKNVVSIVLEQLPANISTSMLIKMTPFIIQKWEKLSDAETLKSKLVQTI